MTFEDLKFERKDYQLEGLPAYWRERAKHTFPNGYGVSVVRSNSSYGGSEGLFELAVLNSNGKIVYDTPITNDVIGWLTPDDVTKLLGEVEKL